MSHKLGGNEAATCGNIPGRESSKGKGLELGVSVVCQRKGKTSRLPEQSRLMGEQRERRGRGSGGRRWRRALQAAAGCEDYVTSYSAPGPVPGTAVAIWHTVALITHVTQVWVLPGPPLTACCSAAAAPSWCLFSFWSGSQSSGRQKNNNDDECFER